MLLLRVTDSRGGVTQHLAETFPYKIGRSGNSNLRLQEAGIFENHAAIVRGENSRFLIRSEGESLLLRNGEAVRTAPIVSGEELSLGSIRLVVSLSPARQKSLGLAEAIVWILLLIVIVAEGAAIVLGG